MVEHMIDTEIVRKTANAPATTATMITTVKKFSRPAVTPVRIDSVTTPISSLSITETSDAVT